MTAKETNLERLEKDIREKLPRLQYYVNKEFGDFKFKNSIFLSDVLEWLGTTQDFDDDFEIASSGYIAHWDNESNMFPKRLNIKWDLSKPYLRDQPE